MGGRRTWAGVVTGALVGSLLSAGVASAEPAGEPAASTADGGFVCADGAVFLTQQNRTQLLAQPGGRGEFEELGDASRWRHNALGFNPVDNHLYALSRRLPLPAGRLLRIGADGSSTIVGTVALDGRPIEATSGAFDDTGAYHVIPRAGESQLVRIDGVTTDAPKATVAADLSRAWAPDDMTFVDGYFWGMAAIHGVNHVWRLDPGSGEVSTFESPARDVRVYGAAWTSVSGDLGFSANRTGMIYQVDVNDPGADEPSFTLVVKSQGPKVVGNNDGASCLPAAPDGFECPSHTTFLSQGTSTRLLARPGGSDGFEQVGNATRWRYNAMAFSHVDASIYALSMRRGPASPPGHLLRIDGDGEVTDLGLIKGIGERVRSVNGAFDISGAYHVVGSARSDDPTLLRVDDLTAQTPTVTVVAELSRSWRPSDITFADGYFWGSGDVNGVTRIWRMDLESGEVSTFESPIEETNPFGAAWTFGNGDLGFAANRSGMTYRVAVDDAGSKSPSFTLVEKSEGPATRGTHDATSC